MDKPKELISKKINELNEQLKNKRQHLSEIGLHIKKLKSDSIRLLEDVNITTGAIQAYIESLRVVETHQSKVPLEEPH